jgi:diamine N-acetyltransferase
MLDIGTQAAEYTQWRFMIAAAHQRQGYGRRALELVVDHVRTLPAATELRTSYQPGAGSPAPFYMGFGFEETGELDDGERVLRLPLA